MNVKIQGGGGGTYGNTGSCIAVVNYLAHEDIERLKQEKNQEQFFTLNKDIVSDKEVTFKIDNNKAKLCRDESKFFVITISPSKEEIQALGNTTEERTKQFRDYINQGIMRAYANNFGKDLTHEDLLYFAKIHHTRGDKLEDQMHAHIIISRKDITNRIKLSPQTNHRNTKKGAVKGGFDRDSFFRASEQTFDLMFQYNRDFKNSYDYQNTLKNGTLGDIKNLDKQEQIHKQRMAEIDLIWEGITKKIEESKQIAPDITNTPSITQTRSRGRGI